MSAPPPTAMSVSAYEPTVPPALGDAYRTVKSESIHAPGARGAPTVPQSVSPAVPSPGGERAVRIGRDRDSSPPGRTSVGELQQALRIVRAAREVPDSERRAQPIGPGRRSGEVSSATGTPAGWIAVLAAHAGAGASTVALAVADAADASGGQVHLIECAEPARSGLAGVTHSELGTDDCGGWRRGVRSGILLDRRVEQAIDRSDAWPSDGLGTRSANVLTIVDLAASREVRAGAIEAPCVLVVLRVCVPGVIQTEAVLSRLDGPIIAAAVGPSRWPPVVAASAGPRLRALREAGRVVSVPVDRHLSLTGLSAEPLPKPILAAGRALVQMIARDDATDAKRFEQVAELSR